MCDFRKAKISQVELPSPNASQPLPMNRGRRVHAKCANHVAAISHATKLMRNLLGAYVDAINAVWVRGHGLSGKMVARNQLNRFSRADAISKASHHEEESRGDQQRCDSRTAGGSVAFQIFRR